MKKLNKKIVSVIAVALLTLPFGISASAYTIDNTYQLTLSEGDSRRAANKFVVLHDVGTESSALNNAIYMKRAWSQTESYTQFIVGDGGKVYKIGEDGYISWGAGSYVNANAPVQIELAHTYDKATFDKDYAVYVNLTRDYAIKYGIPLTLDAGNMYTPGIKSHLWVTNNIWGDHTDPYGYLARFGVTKEKLAADLKTGLNEGSATVPPVAPPVNPVQPPTTGFARSYNENGTMYATERNWVKDTPTKAARLVEYQSTGQAIKYHKVVWSDGIVWLQLTGWDGKQRYVAYSDATQGNGFGHKYGYCL
ncbi:N-acetylmuramoyl-L-alanine amidase [Carnobacterium divergens]|uniref:N-acetylmuramoyl-L-alanine amidase n=1 Tax=Carnobacterium divergens TaxID=2748 RepID=UPI002891A564|nr:N-acetylmuramoyl-L-alanine amidase [Carnobacterium divergens]MDT1997222.1 N-acetylmuramoyl-L-alanine amidase [Carnobacterium divergens]